MKTISLNPKFYTGQTVHTIGQNANWFYEGKSKVKQIGVISNRWITITKYELENGEQVFEENCFATKKQAEAECKKRNQNPITSFYIGNPLGIVDTSQMTVKVNGVEIKCV